MDKNNTEWKRMCFKDKKVWVLTNQNGSIIVDNGKVLIKYQLNQDHEYWAHEKWLKPIEQWQPAQKKDKTKKTKREKEKKQSIQNESIPDDAICLHTDGASSGNPGPSGIGVLLRYGEHEKEISKHIGLATNNIAELEAIKTGLLELKKMDIPVRLYTDSGYAYGLLALNWKAKKNKELVQNIRELMSQFKDLKLIKVKGHDGIEGNERVDKLATLAIKNSKK